MKYDKCLIFRATSAKSRDTYRHTAISMMNVVGELSLSDKTEK